MSFHDRLKYIKSRLFEKRNYLFTIILSLIVLVFLVCITASNFISNSVTEIKQKNFLYRTLYVYSNDKIDNELINNIEHVIYNVSNKYQSGFASVSKFDTDLIKGTLEVIPLIDSNDLNIINGKNITDIGQVVIPNSFYPHDLYINDNGDVKIYNDLFVDGKELIGTTFTIPSSDEFGKDIEVTVVGTYDATQINVTANTCFISINDFDSIASKYASSSKSIYEDGTIVYENIEYNDRLVRVNELENVEYVINELKNLGLTSVVMVGFDTDMINLIIIIPLMICAITMIVAINLLFNYLNKKMSYRNKNYGILKACGYSNENIIQTELTENILIFTLSYFISLSLYFIIFHIVSENYMSEYVFSNIYIQVPTVYLVLTYILFIFLVLFISVRLLRRKLNHSVQDLLKRD